MKNHWVGSSYDFLVAFTGIFLVPKAHTNTKTLSGAVEHLLLYVKRY